MEQIDFEYGGKHCQLIIFDKYEKKTIKGEFNRLTKLVTFFDEDNYQNDFDIKKTIHTGLWKEHRHKQLIIGKINPKNRIILDKNKIEKLVRDLYKKYHRKIYCDFLRIFVYPNETRDNNTYMLGIDGYTPMENTVHIHINPNDPRWENTLNSTILHEASHAYLYIVNKVYRGQYEGKWLNLVDSMISEGLSENYANSIMKTAFKFKKNEWFGFSKKECIDQFKLLKNRIYELRDDDNDIMFGGGKYKRLTGYAIGYWIVKDYLKNTKKNIYDAHHASFKDILEGSGWLN